MLEVHGGAAQEALVRDFYVAKALPLPQAAQASPAGTNADSTGSGNAPAHAIVGEWNENAEMEAGWVAPNLGERIERRCKSSNTYWTVAHQAQFVQSGDPDYADYRFAETFCRNRQNTDVLLAAP